MIGLSVYASHVIGARHKKVGRRAKVDGDNTRGTNRETKKEEFSDFLLLTSYFLEYLVVNSNAKMSMRRYRFPK